MQKWVFICVVFSSDKKIQKKMRKMCEKKISLSARRQTTEFFFLTTSFLWFFPLLKQKQKWEKSRDFKRKSISKKSWKEFSVVSKVQSCVGGKF